MMRVRLTQKLAEHVDGIDLRAAAVGDVLELPDRQAQCLIRERWAVAEDAVGGRRSDTRPELAASAAAPRPGRRKRRSTPNASRV